MTKSRVKSIDLQEFQAGMSEQEAIQLATQNSNNPFTCTQLTDTGIFALLQKTTYFYDNQSFFDIDPMGDGNCGLYAFAAYLIHCIQKKGAKFPDHAIDALVTSLCDEQILATIQAHLELYAQQKQLAVNPGANSYPDLVEPLTKVIEQIKQLKTQNRNPADSEVFLQMIKDATGRFDVTAWSIAMGIALRPLATSKVPNDFRNGGEFDTTKDTKHIGEEQFGELETLFQVNVVLYQSREIQRVPTISHEMNVLRRRNKNANQSTAYFVSNGAHWHLLLPESEKNTGILTSLAANPKISQQQQQPGQQQQLLVKLEKNVDTLLTNVWGKLQNKGEDYKNIFLSMTKILAWIQKITNCANTGNQDDLRTTLTALRQEITKVTPEFNHRRGWDSWLNTFFTSELQTESAKELKAVEKALDELIESLPQQQTPSPSSK